MIFKTSIPVFVICTLFSFNVTYAQKECKVLIENLQGTYEGKCKKGFAHGKGKAVGVDTYEGRFLQGLPSGKGTYIWANGDKYTGLWKAGKREGEGVLIAKINMKDSILNGIWENDKYKGPKPIPPKILNSYNVDNIRFTKNGDYPKRVLIEFKQNGMRNSSVTDIILSSSHGSESSIGLKIGYNNAEFPIRVKLSYYTNNKLKTQRYRATVEFEIFEPGDWEVELTN